MSLHRLNQAAWCGLVLLMACLSPAWAGSFQVHPVRVTLSAGRPVASLTVQNTGSAPAVIQLQMKHWAQENGEDRFSDSRDLLVTPPIFTVPAGGTQVVRVGLRRAADPQAEQAYRLFLQEVPPPRTPGFQGLQIALRLSVPVFVVPAVAPTPNLRWEAIAKDTDTLELVLTNSSAMHVQLLDLQLARADGATVARRSIVSYLLPGQQRRWRIDTERPVLPGTSLRLAARTDAGDMPAEVTIKGQ